MEGGGGEGAGAEEDGCRGSDWGFGSRGDADAVERGYGEADGAGLREAR